MAGNRLSNTFTFPCFSLCFLLSLQNNQTISRGAIMSDIFITNQTTGKAVQTLRRSVKAFAVLCVLALLCAAIFVVVSADSVTLQLDGLDISYEGGKWTGDGRMLSGTATGTAAINNQAAASVTSIMTMTNVKDTTAVLAFNYAKPSVASGGWVKLDGTGITAAGNFRKNLEPGESITIEIKSGNPGPSFSTLEINNIQFVEIKTVTTTFLPAEGGTYTVNGDVVNADTAISLLSSDAYTLVACIRYIPEPNAGQRADRNCRFHFRLKSGI